MNEKLSQKIYNLSFLCALLVVAIHVCKTISTDTLARAFWHLTRGGVCRIAVPFFFVFSGFFLARRIRFGIGDADPSSHWGDYRGQLLKRVRTLLAPYCLWSLIVFGWKVLLDGVAPWYDITTIRGIVKVFGLNLFSMPLLGAMWYVRALMLFTLVSPAIFYLVRKSRGCILILLFAAYAMLAPGEPPQWMQYDPGLTKFFRVGISLEGLFFFSLGAYLQDHHIHVGTRFASFCGLTAVALILLRMFCITRHYSLPICLRTLFIPTAMLFVWHFTPSARWPTVLTQACFPIYVMHGIVLKGIETFVKIPHGLAFLLIQFASAATIPILFAAAVRRFTPRIGDLLYGSRL